MTERTVEDRLREEYVVLLPEIRAVVEESEAEIRHSLVSLSSKLNRYEQLSVTSRVKDCESAMQALRRREEGATFDPGKINSYTLTSIPDLAGVRVLAFPSRVWNQADELLQKRFTDWRSNPILDAETKDLVAFKYDRYWTASTKFRGELQIVPMLIGLFWQVEHSTMYKPSPELKGVAEALEMQHRRSEVSNALRAYEAEFERLIQANPLSKA